ncbi:MAG: hypothetical protein U0790_00835 [Isosphaeraceae bacterium]
MTEMSPGSALRQLQRAQAGLKRARQSLVQARPADDPQAIQAALRVGWASLAQCHRLLAEIPLEAATEPVLTKQLAVQRYATALLVRLRRLVRNEPGALDGDDDFDTEE